MHYKSLAKYLRAVEKSLLVTSTWDSFPLPIGGEAKDNCGVVASDSLGGTTTSSAPPTPRFDPIPFLHDDARTSRSPSPAPLMLGAAHVPIVDEHEQKAIGLVDELDDPSPGHLSDHPHAISATTTVTSKPTPSLADRFVKSGEGESQTEGSSAAAAAAAQPGTEADESKASDDMVIDDPEKENKSG